MEVQTQVKFTTSDGVVVKLTIEEAESLFKELRELFDGKD